MDDCECVILSADKSMILAIPDPERLNTLLLALYQVRFRTCLCFVDTRALEASPIMAGIT